MSAAVIAETLAVKLTMPYVEASPIALPYTRDDLAVAFGALGLNKGAEIGVERGHFSEVLLKANPDLELLCVDAWQAYRGYREHVSQIRLDGFLQETLLRLQPYKATVRRGFSVDVAATVPDGSLGFVYLDGNHTFPQVVADIAAWAPKVRKGGILAGHDFGRSAVGHVREAVEAWTGAYRIAPWFILTADKSPTWLWVAR